MERGEREKRSSEVKAGRVEVPGLPFVWPGNFYFGIFYSTK